MIRLLIFSGLLLASVTTLAQAVNVHGTGPLHVQCKDAKGNLTVVNANKLLYSGNGKKSFAAIGFGPRIQDDGLQVLEGDCVIKPNTAPTSP